MFFEPQIKPIEGNR